MSHNKGHIPRHLARGKDTPAPVKYGIISMDTTPETLALSSSAAAAAAEHEKLVSQVDRLARARSVIVSTDDARVRARLRALSLPMTLFGEGEAERRERLRSYLADLEMEGIDSRTAGLSPGDNQDIAADDGGVEAMDETELVYTEADPALVAARHAILAASQAAAAARRARLAATLGSRDAATLEEDRIRSLGNATAKHVYVSSQRAGRRTVAHCALAPDGARLATCSWHGCVKVWDAASCELILDMPTAHEERASGVAWSPAAGAGGVDLASCAADMTIKLWNVDAAAAVATRDEAPPPRAVLTGHRDRVSRVAFTPTGDYLASTSFDATWRLWDVASETELLLQDGHSRPVYALGMHPDGSLVGTGGLDALGRVWDLRTGRTAMVLQGHVHAILALDMADNGYHVATGGDDNSVIIWDLRKQHAVYILPAHTKLVSDLAFIPGGSSTLVTASYDATLRLWSGTNMSLLRTYTGHSDKVTSVAVAANAAKFVSSSFDRTFKVWASP
ncbi:uncharacterized protein AMSG_08479 [Thecamonas trahens ATCC 50062]|uniref:Pre-mRNA processing factor 4 (PRP4)-like domain-containing protein n=1 Tax=Thecamonas trahens ATCC 50062 TaxID=461836 RepID=A0A0L0DK94_THETB|nr:hypothetical protein AMSG_08479 [Thecamonas trahens ATCC 50062]KNC52615.1 hypothetical protein AMSG_08479 [Thecamonas trahens ATCC 50062]|eukprot:XP_013755173.1 hypothetical protein AMSG_08479 [Thecamonas trahens ATCC 50062]